MKKWFIIISILILFLLIGVSAYAYHSIRSPLLQDFEQARSYVIGQDLLETIDDIDYYYGTEAYYVLKGIGVDGRKQIVWVSDQFDFHHSEFRENGLTEEEARAMVPTKDVKKIESVKLGFERGLPVYEVIYFTVENRKGYYYMTFTEGEFMKRYTLRTSD